MQLNVTQNNKLLFRAVTLSGYVGIWTGQKENAFTISGNERFNGSIWQNILDLHKDYVPSGFPYFLFFFLVFIVFVEFKTTHNTKKIKNKNERMVNERCINVTK